MIKIAYAVSQKFIDNEYIVNGKQLTNPQYVEINENDPELTIEERWTIVNLKNLPKPRFGYGIIRLGYLYIEPGTSGDVPMPSFRRPPQLAIRENVYDNLISPRDALVILRGMINDLDEYASQLAEATQEFEKQVKIEEQKRVEQAQLAERQAAEKLAQEEQRRLQRAVIPWKPDGTAVVNLWEALKAASRLAFENRDGFNRWALEVKSIDWEKKDGFLFVGTFVPYHTIEIAKGEKHVYVVASELGSRRTKTTYYSVVVLTPEGDLADARIDTNSDEDRNWALVIRDRVAELLK